jgi:hypothetical protein
MNSEKLSSGHKRKLEEMVEQQGEQSKRLRRESDICGQALEEVVKKGTQDQRCFAEAYSEIQSFIRVSEKEYYQSIQRIRVNLQQLKKV